MSDTNDDFETTDDATTGTPSTDAAATTAGAAATGATTEPSSPDLSKLQSERDKETARANKLQKELDALKGASAKDASTAPTALPPEMQLWLTTAQDNLRDSLYKGDPRFAEYGVDPTLISGQTPAEMQASAKSLVGFVDQLEGKVRNQVLKEHGFNPEPLSSQRAPARDWATMSKEDFDKAVEAALRG